MAFTIRIFAIIIMSLILAFSLIHLGVSVGIIVVYRKYSDIFRPLLGLSAFNLVVCVFGFLTGILGLLAIKSNSQRFGRVVALVSTLLFILTLASLIAAIVINAKSPDYVRSHLTMNMARYESDSNARDRINDINDAYTCCGTDLWLDWSNIKLNGTPAPTNTTTTTTTTTTAVPMNNTATAAPMTTASTVTPMITVSTVAPVTTASTVAPVTTASTATPEVTPAQTVTGGVTNEGSTTTATGTAKNVKRALSSIYDYFYPAETLYSIESSRSKRQTTDGLYGGISNLPATFSIVLPASCCGANAKVFNVSSIYYCLSSVNGVANEFSTMGCAKSVDTVAGNQAMGLGIINSFLVVLAFAAIPIMLEIESFFH